MNSVKQKLFARRGEECCFRPEGAALSLIRPKLCGDSGGRKLRCIDGGQPDPMGSAPTPRRYRQIAGRTTDEDFLARIQEKIAELEQRLREIDE
jgi:hypothetical protein